MIILHFLGLCAIQWCMNAAMHISCVTPYCAMLNDTCVYPPWLHAWLHGNLPVLPPPSLLAKVMWKRSIISLSSSIDTYGFKCKVHIRVQNLFLYHWHDQNLILFQEWTWNNRSAQGVRQDWNAHRFSLWEICVRAQNTQLKRWPAL